MFLGWRIGFGELLVCGGLILFLIVIPALVYWRKQRLHDKDR